MVRLCMLKCRIDIVSESPSNTKSQFGIKGNISPTDSLQIKSSALTLKFKVTTLIVSAVEH